MSDLPRVWRNGDLENLTVVYEECTVSYELVEKDAGEDRMPKLTNNRYIGYGADGIKYYKGWNKIAEKDPENENRLPLAFQTNEYVEVVYHNRTEIYKEKKVYPKGSEGRIWEELDNPENFYRGDGFREVAP